MTEWTKPDSGFWRTKDGTQIAIKDMEDSHLKNALRLQQRAAAQRLAIENIEMIYGYQPTGDMAQLAFENAQIELLEATWEDRVGLCFEEMVEEAEKRKLDWEPYSNKELEKIQFNIEMHILKKVQCNEKI